MNRWVDGEWKGGTKNRRRKHKRKSEFSSRRDRRKNGLVYTPSTSYTKHFYYYIYTFLA